MQSRTSSSTKTPYSFCYLFQTLAGQSESRQKLGKDEAARHNWRDQGGTRARHRTGFVQFEGRRAVISRLAGALLRAVLGCVADCNTVAPVARGDRGRDPDRGAGVDLRRRPHDLRICLGLSRALSNSATRRRSTGLRFVALFATVFLIAVVIRGEVEPTASDPDGHRPSAPISAMRSTSPTARSGRSFCCCPTGHRFDPCRPDPHRGRASAISSRC